MYTKDGENYFVVDGHIHHWDASPQNQANEYGKGFIECFYGYHSALSPEEYVWPLEDFLKYSPERLMADLFDKGHVDVGIFQPTYLTDFYVNGFNTTEQDAVLKQAHPDKFVLNARSTRVIRPKASTRSRSWWRPTTSRASSCTPPSGKASRRVGA